MREITNKTELAEFFRDKLLPYYEQHYREDLTLDDALGLNLNYGLCWCALKVFEVYIYPIIAGMTSDCMYLFPASIKEGHTAKESLLPRIEWMRKFINDNN